ncbi:uncharacterized protein PV06_08078 [Exophiala oligosperma]|uniref:Uncharacterized protein n=1 Tax=Exophiala oligosperma TaxID=215243 RepID=A0A0D2BPJ2_9EURO|nr:uncharacterized protein PV06_08078 [Exophiala oligosperma]KIW39467.1 hypothetical protein PV06_08078 [Exophiala oligosperma]
MHSDIHVIVRFQEQSVFAGEELKCTITFKNIANLAEPPVTPSIARRRSSRHESISQIAAISLKNHAHLRLGQNGRSVSDKESHSDSRGRHRATASLQSPINTTDLQSPTERPGYKQRSVSIISVTSPIGNNDHPESSSPNSWARQQRLSHQRSSTVQLQHAPHQSTASQFSKASPGTSPQPPQGRRRSPLSPAIGGSRESTSDFRFPPASPDTRPQTLSPGGDDATRVLSRTSQVTSERSSGDFYSLSNHSQETLMSEQPSVLSDHRPNLSLSRAPFRPAEQKPRSVSLLMGYAQLNATFTLDASLIDQSHFEEVKSKGFLGGQAGGGVVGMKKPRPNSGFLGTAFSLKDFSESLNSLLGGDDTSSVKQMHAVKNSRAIPLLSTPQSLLFVDMHLDPGEEQSYTYTYPLPRGLPSSYRGKSIKISYNLTVGVQGGRDVHTVRQVNVPVRVFSGVDYDGEIFGHDLMQPHVILQDLARTKSIISLPSQTTNESNTPTTPSQQQHQQSDEQSSAEFLVFVDKLLNRNMRRQSSSSVTMESYIPRHYAGADSKALQAINRAIVYSNQNTDVASSSSNRFEISRNGLKVAVVVIDRPLHRLGETITAVIDFSDGQVCCASLRSTLESTEKVSPSLAVRSAATINRVTRKTYGAQAENVLFARRATFAPSIPASATPTFVTSGVNLEWSLRFEFGTVKTLEGGHDDDDDGGDNNNNNNNDHGVPAKPAVELVEEVVRDERGTINVAVENLDCETFEVVIPITVYGDLVPDGRGDGEVVGIPI